MFLFDLQTKVAGGQEGVEERLSRLKTQFYNLVKLQSPSLEAMQKFHNDIKSLSDQIGKATTPNSPEEYRAAAFCRAAFAFLTSRLSAPGAEKFKGEVQSELNDLNGYRSLVKENKAFQSQERATTIYFHVMQAMKNSGLILTQQAAEDLASAVADALQKRGTPDTMALPFSNKQNAEIFAKQLLPILPGVQPLNAKVLPGRSFMGLDNAPFGVAFSLVSSGAGVPEYLPAAAAGGKLKQERQTTPMLVKRVTTEARQVSSSGIISNSEILEAARRIFTNGKNEQEHKVNLRETGAVSYGQRFLVEDEVSKQVAGNMVDFGVAQYAWRYYYETGKGNIVDFLKSKQGQEFLVKLKSKGETLELWGSASQEGIYDGTNFEEWLVQAKRNLSLACDRAQYGMLHVKEINEALKKAGCKELLAISSETQEKRGSVYFFQGSLPTEATPEMQKTLKKHGFKSLDEAYKSFGYDSGTAQKHFQSFMETLKEKDSGAHSQLLSSGAVTLGDKTGEYAIVDAKKLHTAFYTGARKGGMRDEANRNPFVQAIEESGDGSSRSITLKKKVDAKLGLEIERARPGLATLSVTHAIGVDKAKFEGKVVAYFFEDGKRYYDAQQAQVKVEQATDGKFNAHLPEKGGRLVAYAEAKEGELNSGLVSQNVPSMLKGVKVDPPPQIVIKPTPTPTDFQPMRVEKVFQIETTIPAAFLPSGLFPRADFFSQEVLNPAYSQFGGRADETGIYIPGSITGDQHVRFIESMRQNVPKWLDQDYTNPVTSVTHKVRDEVRDQLSNPADLGKFIDALSNGNFETAVSYLKEGSLKEALGESKNTQNIRSFLTAENVAELMINSFSGGVGVKYDLSIIPGVTDTSLYIYLQSDQTFLVTNRVGTGMVSGQLMGTVHLGELKIKPQIGAGYRFTKGQSPMLQTSLGAGLEFPLAPFLSGLADASFNRVYAKGYNPMDISRMQLGAKASLFDSFDISANWSRIFSQIEPIDAVGATANYRLSHLLQVGATGSMGLKKNIDGKYPYQVGLNVTFNLPVPGE